LRLHADTRYAVDLSKQEAYSIFSAEVLVMEVPTIITPEVANMLVAELTPFRYGLVLITCAMISTWGAVIPKYLSLVGALAGKTEFRVVYGSHNILIIRSVKAV
jgi:hypothetical protein